MTDHLTRRLVLLTIGLVVVAGFSLLALHGPPPPASVDSDVLLVVVPLAAEGNATGRLRTIASDAAAEVKSWFVRHDVSVATELQDIRSSTAGERLFTATEASTPCSDAAWQRALPMVQPVRTPTDAARKVIVVVLGGVIRSANSPRPTLYGLTCRLGNDACSEAVDVAVPGQDEQINLDALIAIDWRPEHATPLAPVLAHEVGHALGLAHATATSLPCQMPADGGTRNLMTSAMHIQPGSRLSELNLTPAQERWLSDTVNRPKGEQS